MFSLPFKLLLAFISATFLSEFQADLIEISPYSPPRIEKPSTVMLLSIKGSLRALEI
jgi:hypothetical protein